MPDANGNPTAIDNMMGNTAAPQLNPQVQQMIQALQGGQAPTGIQAPYGVPAPQSPAATPFMTPQYMQPGGGLGNQPLTDQGPASPGLLNALQGPPDAGY